MSPIDLEGAPEGIKRLLEHIQLDLGVVPNLLLVLANAPAVLEGFLALRRSLEEGVLPQKLRQQIALAVAERNHSLYSAAGHAAFGRAVGLSEEEIQDARQGRSPHGRVQAALRFACNMVEKRGRIGDQDIARLRAAGYGDREVLEISAWVCVAICTDYFAEVTQAEIDFPGLLDIRHTQ